MRTAVAPGRARPVPIGSDTHVAALDGLRGVAVLAVLAYHSGFGWARGGFLGVSMFFTLSGFLITTLLLTEADRTGRVDLRRFWTRRLRRLLPAALLTITVVTVASLWFATPGAAGDARADGLAALFNVANWHFVLDGSSYAELFTAPSPFTHFWSLAIEEQFYLLFPLVLGLTLFAARGRRPHIGRWVVGGVLLSLALASVLATFLHDPARDLDRIYYGTDTRAFELLLGCLLAWWLRRDPSGAKTVERGDRRGTGPTGALGGAALVAAFVMLATTPQDATWLYRGGLVLFGVISALVIRAALVPSTAVARALGWAPLGALGVISYGVYLFHWPLFVWLDPPRTGLDGWALFGVRTSITLVLAALSYWAIEAPIRRGGLALPRGRLPSWAAPVAMALVAAVVVLVAAGRPADVSAFDTSSTPEDAVEALEPRRSPAGPPRVLVVGDSVAGSLAEGLIAWGVSTGRLEVGNLGSAACAVVEGGEVDLSVPWATTTDCGDWTLSRTTAVGIFEPDVVVALTGPWDIVDRRMPGWDGFRRLGDRTFDDWLVDEYAAQVDAWSRNGARVVWLTAPCADEISGPLAGTGAFDLDRLEYLRAEIVPRLADRRPAIETIDLFERVCPAGEATDAIEGVAGGRPDGVHFSVEGAVALGNWLGPQLEALAREGSDLRS